MNSYIKNKTGFIQFLLQHKTIILVGALFLLHLFLRFYGIETKSIFVYDQVDSAWAAKNIIIDHNYPLIGAENKLGSGVHIGPLYYYISAAFYYLTNMDPIAAGLLAGTTSVLGFFILFYVAKKMFSTKVAIIALFINTVSYSAIEFERIQWEVNFIPIISTLSFYFLYRILLKHERNILYFALVYAFALHIHLTTVVFLPLILLFTLPFFPKTKKTLYYILLSIPIVLAGLASIIIYNIITGNSQAAGSLGYANSSFHGIHLTRMIQLLSTAFIQIESFTVFPMLRPISFLLLPIFFTVYFLNTPTRKKFIVVALIFLSFIIPWIVLSAYSGEITNYYFSTNRFVGLIALSYLFFKLLMLKKTFITLCILIFALYYLAVNLQIFIKKPVIGLSYYRSYVKEHIKELKIIPFQEGSPVSYLYYLYTRNK